MALKGARPVREGEAGKFRLRAGPGAANIIPGGLRAVFAPGMMPEHRSG